MKKSIKILVTVIITGALGLEGWNLYLYLQGESLPTNLHGIFWIGSLILIAHCVEGLIAATKANSRNKDPLKYGIYTFFVGFFGLQELSELSTEKNSEKNY